MELTLWGARGPETVSFPGVHPQAHTSGYPGAGTLSITHSFIPAALVSAPIFRTLRKGVQCSGSQPQGPPISIRRAWAWGQDLGSGPSPFHFHVTLSPLQEPSWPQFLYLSSGALGKPRGSEGRERPINSSIPHWWTAPLAVGGGGGVPRAQYHRHYQPKIIIATIYCVHCGQPHASSHLIYSPQPALCGRCIFPPHLPGEEIESQ